MMLVKDLKCNTENPEYCSWIDLAIFDKNLIDQKSGKCKTPKNDTLRRQQKVNNTCVYATHTLIILHVVTNFVLDQTSSKLDGGRRGSVSLVKRK